MAEKAKLKEILVSLEELHDRKQFNKLLFFKPYPKQKNFFDLGRTKRERLFMAANRVGKSEAGAYEAAVHATGDYPDWWDGLKFDHPTRGWAAGVTSLDVRNIQQKKLCGDPGVTVAFGTGYIPKNRFMDKPSMARGVTDAYDTVQVSHKTNGVEDGISTIHFKSYEQGREKFQGDEIDWGWGDEEGPMDVYAEFLTRLGANGRLFTTFTPLLGKTELVIRFMEEMSPDRSYVNMTLEEAEHFSEDDKKQRLAGYRRHERDARGKGVPLLGSGRVFPYEEATITEAALDYIPPAWVKLWGIDFGIGHPFAAVLILWDRDNDVIHVYHCVRMVDDERLSLPIHHAAAMKPIGASVPVAWPQDGTAREKGSGEPLALLYRKQGLIMLPDHATHADGSVSTEAGIMEIDERMATGRFKVSAQLSDWFEEYRTYHRKDGQIVKERDDLMSATRVAVMMKRFARLAPLGGYRKKRMQNPVAEDVDFDLS